VTPRRFARVFEFDRNGPPWEGSPEQQQTIRDLLAEHMKNPRFDAVIYALDRARNAWGVRFIPIRFVDFSGSTIGFATPSTISFKQDIDPLSLRSWLLLHELGHSVGWNVLYPKDSSETWAWDFQYWVQTGCPDGPVWDKLVAAMA
jgi:hypothetical protein